MWRDQQYSRDRGPDPPPDRGLMQWLSNHLIDINVQLSHLNTSQQHIFGQIENINRQLEIGDQRMDRMERQPAQPPGPTQVRSRIVRATDAVNSAKEFAQAVASFKEWLGGAVIVASSATAVSNPDPAAALLRWLLALLGVL